MCNAPESTHALLSRPARMAIIGHLGQFNCSALSSGQKQQQKPKPNSVWGEKPLPYNSVRPFYSLFVCLSEKFLLSPCESAHNFLLFHFFFPPIQQDLLLTLAKRRKIKQKNVVRVFNEKNFILIVGIQSLISPCCLQNGRHFCLLCVLARSFVRLPYRLTLENAINC